VERVGAKRVLVDSLKDLEIATANKVRYKDYIYSLVNNLKTRGITTIVTNEIPELFGPFQLSEYGVSFIADNVALLRYVELDGQIERAISVLKARGSQHSKSIHRFTIDNHGIQIGAPIRFLSGILAGTPVSTQSGNFDRFSPLERYVWSILSRMERASAQDIADITHLPLETVKETIDQLVINRSISAIDNVDPPEYTV